MPASRADDLVEAGDGGIRVDAVVDEVREGLAGEHAVRLPGAFPGRGSPHVWLTDLIRQIHIDFRGVYCYRRVHAELTLEHGQAVGEEAAWLLMRKGLCALKRGVCRLVAE